MTHPPLPLEPEALLAVSTFLRGIERRAAVFAALQCGSAARGDQAVAAAMLGFRHAAAERPLADWNLQFWRLLLATGPLRQTAAGAQWPASLAVLAAQSTPKRAVLLLHLVSGLDASQAAGALCVAPERYAQASRQGLGAGGGARNAALAEAMQQSLRRIPAARLIGLAQSRERALRGARPAPLSRRFEPLQRTRALGLCVAACVIAFAATFLLDGSVARGARPHALPPAPPLETFDADFALLTHRDFDQLATQGDPALLDHFDFYAWYAAQTAPATDAPANSLQTPLAGRPAAVTQPGGRHGGR